MSEGEFKKRFDDIFREDRVDLIMEVVDEAQKDIFVELPQDPTLISWLKMIPEKDANGYVRLVKKLWHWFGSVEK